MRPLLVLSLVLGGLWTHAAAAEPGMLDLIPEDAAGAIVCRSLNDLKKKADRLCADIGDQVFVPSQAIDNGIQILGVRDGLDLERPAAVVLANAAKLGIANPQERAGELAVVVVPFSDRAKMAANFGVKEGTLKPDTVVKTMAAEKNRLFGLFLLVHGNYLFLGNNEKAVASVAEGPSAHKALNADQQRALEGADVLVLLGTEAWGFQWKAVLGTVEESIARAEASDRQIGKQLVESLASVRFGMLAIRLEGGLGLRLLAVLPAGADQPARKFLTQLQGGSGGTELTGLPEGEVIAAQATRGDGSRNTQLAKLLVNSLLTNLGATQEVLSAADRPLAVGIFTEIWKYQRGTRAAVYTNRDKQGLGLLSAVAIIDTDNAEVFLKEVKHLARFAAGKVEDLADNATQKNSKEVMAQLIADLGANQFTARESATTKLRLLGESALPYLEPALTSDDLEVRRRAESIKQQIVESVALQRKQLLKQGLQRPIRPTFAVIPQGEMLDGHPLDVVQMRLGNDEAASAQLRQLFGPDWSKIRLARHGKQVVVLLGSDRSLLQTTLTNLQKKRPGLEAAKLRAPFFINNESARKIELHVAVQAALALFNAEDLKFPKEAARPTGMAGLGVLVDPDRFQVDWWVPVTVLRLFVNKA
jgi:hypothetical protein